MMKRKAFTLIELLVVIAIIAILAAILFPVFAKARERGMKAACISNNNQIGKALMMYADDFDESLPPNRFFRQGTSTPVAPYTWKRAMLPYTSSVDIWRCPSNRAYNSILSNFAPNAPARGDESNLKPEYRDGKQLPAGYAYSAGLFYRNGAYHQADPNYIPKLTQIKNPAGTMAILESRSANPDLGPWVVDNGWTCNETGTVAGQNKSYFFTHGNQMNITFADGHTKSMTPFQTYQIPNQWGVPDDEPTVARLRNINAWDRKINRDEVK